MSKKDKKQKKNKIAKPGHVILIVGRGNSGKSFSLNKLKNQENSVYCNTDMKALPIRSNFKVDRFIKNPKKLLKDLKTTSKLPINSMPDTIIIDTFTHLMREYVQQFVEPMQNKMQGWANNLAFYTEFLKVIKLAPYNTILMAHLDTEKDEDGVIINEYIPVAGRPGKTGVETDFSIILHAMTMPIKEVKKFPKNKLLNITKKEKLTGIKRVFLTTPLKRYRFSKARAPDGLFSDDELIIDNDIQIVLDRLDEFYGK